MYEYVGALHIHSVFSDGTGKVEEIHEFAREVDLDFIFLTDHNTMRALTDGYEKYIGNTLLLVGCEINDKENKNHYLALGISEAVSTRLPVEEYVKKVKELGGIGFIAHPHEKRDRFDNHPAYPWNAWHVKDFDGIEIWNHMSEWMESLTEENKYNHLIHPLKTIVSPDTETLKVWDELNLERKVVGVGGVDAHAHQVNLLGIWDFEIFPYKVLFKSIRTHILSDQILGRSNDTESLKYDKSLILKALKAGRCFVSNFSVGDAGGFRFYAESDAGVFQMGDTVKSHKNCTLKISVPNNDTKIKIIYNGAIIKEYNNNLLEMDVEKKGVYRVEVSLEDKAWIFSNHIRIGV